jgi:hypothetical protein
MTAVQEQRDAELQLPALFHGEIINPVAVEQGIERLGNEIGRGVRKVSEAERAAREKRHKYDLAYARAYMAHEGPAHEKRYAAEIATAAQRYEAEVAEVAHRHTERTAKALEKQLIALQSLLGSIKVLYGSTR